MSLILLAGLIFLGLFATAVLPLQSPIPVASHGGIAEVQIFPVPEGPTPPLFERNPAPGHYSLPVTLIQSYIPDPLPAPLNQGLFCSNGGDLVVTLGDETQVAYGPCKRPDSIDRLWMQIYSAVGTYCHPRCVQPTP